MESGPLDKLDVQRIVGIHLDMYLPTLATRPDPISEHREIVKVEHVELELLRSIKEEDEDEETLVDILDIKAEIRP
jgi:hypothetical protein